TLDECRYGPWIVPPNATKVFRGTGTDVLIFILQARDESRNGRLGGGAHLAEQISCLCPDFWRRIGEKGDKSLYRFKRIRGNDSYGVPCTRSHRGILIFHHFPQGRHHDLMFSLISVEARDYMHPHPRILVFE